MKPLMIPLVFARSLIPSPNAANHHKTTTTHHNPPSSGPPVLYLSGFRSVAGGFWGQLEIFAYAGEVQWRLRRRMRIIHFESRVRPVLVGDGFKLPSNWHLIFPIRSLPRSRITNTELEIDYLPRPQLVRTEGLRSAPTPAKKKHVAAQLRGLPPCCSPDLEDADHLFSKRSAPRGQGHSIMGAANESLKVHQASNTDLATRL